MFVLSFKLNNTKLILGVLVIILIVLAGGLLFYTDEEASFTGISKSKPDYIFNSIKTNEDRIKFLNQFGWEVEPEPVEIIEIQIPKEFDKVYGDYNEIQKKIGLNLEKYKGKRVKRYTYRVLNYPEEHEQILANVIIYKNNVIAGDVMNPKLDGFMHSLKKE